jgi:DNA polymerase-3 subunit delta'
MNAPYPWQQTPWQQLQQARQAGQLPHAVLLHGPAGIGKQDFALAAVHSLLCEQPGPADQACGQCKACQLLKCDNHPDFIHIQPEETGKAIKIDQIRELIRQMGLSAHFGGYRVVLISQAEQMNLAAANSLLKTLEEPQPNTLIMLVSSQLSRLPATIRSRCQMLRFAMPARAMAQGWLETQLGEQEQAGVLLNAANGAPMLAIQMAENDILGTRRQLLDDLLALWSGQKQALAVAADWSKMSEISPMLCLYHWLCDLIRAKAAGGQFTVDQNCSRLLQSQTETIDLGKLFQLHDQVNEALRLQQTSANGLLLLEAVLLGWTYLNANPQRRRA